MFGSEPWSPKEGCPAGLVTPAGRGAHTAFNTEHCVPQSRYQRRPRRHALGRTLLLLRRSAGQG